MTSAEKRIDTLALAVTLLQQASDAIDAAQAADDSARADEQQGLAVHCSWYDDAMSKRAEVQERIESSGLLFARPATPAQLMECPTCAPFEVRGTFSTSEDSRIRCGRCGNVLPT
jgi:hypothetical protein